MTKVFNRQKDYVCHGCFLTINLHCSYYQGAHFAGATKVTTIQREAKLSKEKGSYVYLEITWKLTVLPGGTHILVAPLYKALSIMKHMCKARTKDQDGAVLGMRAWLEPSTGPKFLEWPHSKSSHNRKNLAELKSCDTKSVGSKYTKLFSSLDVLLYINLLPSQ